jgi:hypothetical protein
MPLINPPVKPFSSYKWKWASYQPSESLNKPPIFLGVLRVFNRFQNFSPNSPEVVEALRIVQHETKTDIDLVRTPERNLLRNSGQYWKALGLLEEAHGKILVSTFGQLLASGKITPVEFATTVIKTLELPNKRIGEDTSGWDEARLKIKPLELILDVLAKISEQYDSKESFLTPFELVRIVIPLAGAKAPLSDYADAIIQYRQGRIDVSKWPDCAPGPNDGRLAREFLLFLNYYGFLNVVKEGKINANEKYFLNSISKEEVISLHKIKSLPFELEKAVKKIRESHIPASVERTRVSREVLARPYQGIFRNNILAAYNSTCLITGVNIESVLEASHIKAVEYNGSDKIENGLCLRSDIHVLYDSKHLRILPDGVITLTETADTDNNYKKLPRKIIIPDFVNKEFLYWRANYD